MGFNFAAQHPTSEIRVTQQRWFVTALLVTACGGSSAPPPAQPVSSAAAVVQSFMKAVADSNLAAMGALWGTAAGPASKTNVPPDWQRRVAIMQAYLKNDSFRLTADVPQTDLNRRDLQVELKRQSCTWSVPFVALKTAAGWVVTQVDLTAAGNPARPCNPSASRDTTARS
jgi:hypothetical protein